MIKTVDTRFENDAKAMVDAMHEKKLFREDLTRDDMNVLEKWINDTLVHKYDTEKRLTKLMDKINKQDK